MLGPESDWVKNVEAAHGDAVIRQGTSTPSPPRGRAAGTEGTRPARVLQIAPSGRQHFPLAVGAPLSDFEAIAGRYPVYRIDAS
jgi:hypothetical protein